MDSGAPHPEAEGESERDREKGNGRERESAREGLRWLVKTGKRKKRKPIAFLFLSLPLDLC